MHALPGCQRNFCAQYNQVHQQVLVHQSSVLKSCLSFEVFKQSSDVSCDRSKKTKHLKFLKSNTKAENRREKTRFQIAAAVALAITILHITENCSHDCNHDADVT